MIKKYYYHHQHLSTWLIWCMLVFTFPASGASQAASTVVESQIIKWQEQWPKTDFANTSVNLQEIISGGPPKDGIPAIDTPEFSAIKNVNYIGVAEPVIVVKGDNGTIKGYPIQILIWHEIVNDTIDQIPIAVTYCPLCNSAIVYQRTIDAMTVSFGVSGNLRFSDMIMYDRQSESWWQQFSGTSIVGKHNGKILKKIASQTIPFDLLKRKHPEALILKPPSTLSRPYGKNPYIKYDSSAKPFLYKGDYQRDIGPMQYVIVIDDIAFSLRHLRANQQIEHNELIIRWNEGMNSALDEQAISDGRDIGYIEAFRNQNGQLEPIVYDLSFAFVFDAFYPQGIIVDSSSLPKSE